MSLDQSFANAQALCVDIRPRVAQIETEQDARVQIINRFLTEVLGWNFADIKTEEYSEAGYADYRISSSGRSRLVVEAKHIGPILIDTVNPRMAKYKVGGPALKSAMSGIKQAAAYCLDHGAGYAALTTGITWIIFLPFPTAGVPYIEGVAFVFPTLDSILENFALFYDLLARDSVIGRNYDVHFAKASGLTIEAFESMAAANKNEYVRLLHSTQLASDLEPVFREFFGSLSGDNDPEMLAECFVETRESRYADASLEKIVRSISSSVATLEPNAKSQLVQEIKQAVESGRGETVIIVGNDGSGKSTFMERFFKSVLDTPVRDRCAVVKIDVSKWPGDLDSLSLWLTDELKVGLQKLLYPDGMPTYDELQGLYWREYQSWMRGQYKPLYDSDKTGFKVKFGEFLDQQITGNPYSYVLRVLDDIVRNRKMLPCLIFDNGDVFGFSFQESVFQYAQAIRENIPFSFVVAPVTDRSFWRLSKAGPFQKYPSKMFYLPVPPTKEVLEKRVSFLQRKIESAEDERSYFLAKGIRLTVENIRSFAACLEAVFVKEDFVSRRVSWLANNSLQKCLSLAQSIILSPIFSVDDLVKSYIAYGAKAPVIVNYRKFMQALLHGNYNAFQQDHNLFVWNVFAISPNFPTSPLLILSLLKMLIESSAAEENAPEGYVSVEQVDRYFIAAGIPEGAVEHTLSILLKAKLVQPYDSSKDSIDASERVAITHSGRIHYEMATTDPYFVSDMAFATPLRTMMVVDRLRQLRESNSKMTIQIGKAVQKEFFDYILDQDASFFRLPKDGIYDNQRQLRSELRARWIDEPAGQQLDPDNVAVPAVESENFSQKRAVVRWYSVERGFGFAEAGLPKSIFIHRSVVEQSGIGSIQQGDEIVCDIAPVPKGKLEAIAIHSVQKSAQLQGSPSSEGVLSINGVIDFWNESKGYGFVKAPNLPEDAYLSRRTGNGQFADKMRWGSNVRATVARGRFGKFAVISIESVA
jgi:cold shock CspA family protein